MSRTLYSAIHTNVTLLVTKRSHHCAALKGVPIVRVIGPTPVTFAVIFVGYLQNVEEMNKLKLLGETHIDVNSL